ncbi:MAG: DNA alkylation repair protein [Bacilli bacterium]
MKKILDFLLANRDEPYRLFSLPLIPNVDPAFIIGVRSPVIKKKAKEFSQDPQSRKFMRELPHHYLEEYSIHRQLIEHLNNYDEMIRELDRLLPYIDNWANCDGFSNKTISKNKSSFLIKIKEWAISSHTYTRRFAISMLMRYYLDEDFKEEYLWLVASCDRENDYYLQMMVAWYFATAFAKHYKTAVDVFKKIHLSRFTHNKAIQKACESYRVSDSQKNELRTLKIK